MISTKATLIFIGLAIALCQCTNRNNKQEDNEPSCENTEYFSFIKDRALADSIYTFFRSAEHYEEDDQPKWGAVYYHMRFDHPSVLLYMSPQLKLPLYRKIYLLGSFPFENMQIIMLSSVETIPFMDTSGFNVDQAYSLLGRDYLDSYWSHKQVDKAVKRYDNYDNKWVLGLSSE